MELTPTEQLHYEAIKEKIELLLRSIIAADPTLQDLLIKDLREQCEAILKMLTPTRVLKKAHSIPVHQAHYNAITENMYFRSSKELEQTARACALITEQEKLKFAIEHLTHCYDAYAYQLDDENEVSFKREIKQLQQQLNELTNENNYS